MLEESVLTLLSIVPGLLFNTELMHILSKQMHGEL